MLLTVCAAIPASAQQFFHLTADELRVDTLSAPQFTHVMPLPEAWRDSVYTVRIVYPEYADMAAADVANYKRLVAEQPDAEPKVETSSSLVSCCAASHEPNSTHAAMLQRTASVQTPR